MQAWQLHALDDCARPRPTNVSPCGADGPVCGCHAAPAQQSTITPHNKASMEPCPQPTHREASDIDLHEMAARAIQQKSITVRCIPGHR